MEIQTNKFHKLCYEISVAFETVLPSTKPPVYSADFAFPDLIHQNSSETVVRVYCPSEISEDASGKKQISFLPWLSNESDALFHRLCFRLKPISKTSKNTRSLEFARFEEEKTFGFPYLRNGQSFVPLNFLGYNQEFIPVYLKIKNNGGLVEYYMISAEASEEKVVITLQRVEETTVPPHLQRKSL